MSDHEAERAAAQARIRRAALLPRIKVMPGFDVRAAAAMPSGRPRARETPGTHRPGSRHLFLKLGVAVLVAAPFAVTLASSRGVLIRHTADPTRPEAGPPSVRGPATPAPTPRPAPSRTPAPARTAPRMPSARARPAPTSSGDTSVTHRPPKSPRPPSAGRPATEAPPRVQRQAASGRLLVSLASGRCIDVTGGEPRDGTPLQIRDCTGGARQTWRFEPDGSVRSMGLCMDVAWGSADDGAVVQLVRCHGGPAQHFVLNRAGDLVNLGSGKCVDVTDMETANGTRLQQWECGGTSNQKWRAR